MTTILTQRQRWNIKVLMALVLLAVYHNSLRIRTYLLWASLVPPSLSLWRKLCRNLHLHLLLKHLLLH
jgi:hypothetical protein